MTGANLVLGAGHTDRLIPNADEYLRQYRYDTGCYYLDHVPNTPTECIVPEDLAVTLLVNSRASWRAFHSLQLYANTIKLAELPAKPLQETSATERTHVASVIAQMAALPGFAASVATKVLHKKRPDLIPVLDNQAIFGAYMNPHWPKSLARTESIKSVEWIFSALEWISYDITRRENDDIWPVLQAIEPARTRIQLFDSVWWMYFRQCQPVVRV